jgi:hypothetical protein
MVFVQLAKKKNKQSGRGTPFLRGDEKLRA